MKFETAILILVLSLLLILPFIGFMANNNTNNGIHIHESGQAVYLDGEACTVNATPDITKKEFAEMLFWCSEMRESTTNN